MASKRNDTSTEARTKSVRRGGQGREKQATAQVSRKARLAAKTKSAKRPPVQEPSASTRSSTSKQAQIITLLRRPGGATIEDLAAVTQWQHHSIRGLISGVLRKKLGLSVGTIATDHGRSYCIVGHD